MDAVSNVATEGTRTHSSEFTLDGIPIMTQGGQLSFSRPPEMIREFRVETAAFDASIGHFTGAHINMVLKSGTNTPHGNLLFSHVSRPLYLPRPIDYHSHVARADWAFRSGHRLYGSLTWSYLLEAWGNAFHNPAGASSPRAGRSGLPG